MSNALHKRRMAEHAARRAMVGTVQHERPALVVKTGVSIVRTGKFIMKACGWIDPATGEKRGRKMRVREVACAVSTREVRQSNGREVHLVSGVGERPNYVWTGPQLRG